MADVVSMIQKNIIICGGLAASIFVNTIFWVYVIVKSKILTPPIIIRYNVYFGAELMGGISNVYMLPAIGLILIVINATLIIFLRKKSQVASGLLIGSLFLSQIFLFIAGITLVMINT